MVKKILKGIGIAVAALLVIVQFVRPEKNTGGAPTDGDIAATYDVPADIQTILRTSCYDCHSNNTRYPWYAEIQPIGWMLNRHITEGKRELNFSEFASRKPRWQYRKFEEIVEQVEKAEMPLPSYLLAHADARLSDEQKARLISWAREMQLRIKNDHPDESFERRK
jgi:hypothetical protein